MPSLSAFKLRAQVPDDGLHTEVHYIDPLLTATSRILDFVLGQKDADRAGHDA
jgi:hypothetical protein